MADCKHATASDTTASGAHLTAAVAIQPNCHFLELPPELRNQIYSPLLEFLCKGRAFYPTKSKPFRKTQDMHPNILATCRQINGEATSILYGANRLVLRPFIDHAGFLKTIDRQICHLRRINIEWCGMPTKSAADLAPLLKAKRLNKMKIGGVPNGIQPVEMAEKLLPFVRTLRQTGKLVAFHFFVDLPVAALARGEWHQRNEQYKEAFQRELEKLFDG